MKRQCPPKFTSLGYSKRSMNGGPLAQIPERNEGKEKCSETIVTTSFYDEKNACFRWEYLAPCGRIFCVSPSVGTNLTGRLPWVQLWNYWDPLWKMIKPPKAFNCHGKFMFFYKTEWSNYQLHSCSCFMAYPETVFHISAELSFNLSGNINNIKLKPNAMKIGLT